MVSEIIGIGMIPVFVSAVSDPDMVLKHDLLGPVFSYIGIQDGRELLKYGGLGLVGIFLFKGVYLIWLNYIKNRFIFNRFSMISTNLFKVYMNAPYTFHLRRNSAELIRNVTNETRFIANYVMNSILKVAMEAITAAGIFLMLLFIEPLLTVITFVIIGGGGSLLLKLIKKKLKTFGESATQERARMIQGVDEGINGYKDVNVMNRESFFIDKFKSYAVNFANAEIFKSTAIYASKPVIEFVTVTGMMFIAFFMVWQDRSLGTIIPVLALFGAATVRLMPAINKIVNQLTTFRYYLHSLDPVYQDMVNIEQKKESGNSLKNIGKLTLENCIELKNLSYNYPDSEETVVKNVNITIPKGSAVGFVGPSGAGKSTIVDLILGLLKPNSGEVLVDGVNISTDMRKWQNNVGYIPQSIYLSDDTIRNNIAFGIPEEMISDEKVHEAIKAANLDSHVNNLPRGLETNVGEGGIKLSGGQRQRVGIARALYDNPEVLIMDEATSSLDNITEKKVISAIEELKGDRTVIMIAHRLTTVENCDQLYLMKEGEVIDTGTYSELLDKSEEFQKMNLNE